MKIPKLYPPLIFILLAIFSVAWGNPNIVPKPVNFTPKEGTFSLTKDTSIVYQPFAKSQAELLAQLLRPATGFNLPIMPHSDDIPTANTITLLKAKDPEMHKEGYTINASPTHIDLAAASPAGLAYAAQTLRQLLPSHIFNPHKTSASWMIPCCSIKDQPTFKWRGMMLDVSRYWFNKDFILRYLDIMAMHKMNTLHWHVVDDAGWRIEIKKYPKLTEIGGFRGEGANRYGGFYTQEEIKEIVKYAKVRGITIVPEIEIPAHTLSAIVAYPHLSCHGRQLKMPTRHSISKDLYCPGQETTWEFLENVFSEVCELFPGTYIHIGGDEAKYPNWQKCEHCEKLMKKEGIKDFHSLHGYMNLRVEKMLQAKGKQIIGWDEILKCGVSNKAGIMVWRNWKAAYDGAKRGNFVVMAPTRHCYFDTTESMHPGEPPGTQWIPPVTLKSAYNWHPIRSNMEKETTHNIAGANGCVWSDQFLHKPTILPDKPGEGTRHSESYIEYLSLPRMAALSEVTWTPQELRDWDHFQSRMKHTYERYHNAGYSFRLPIPNLVLEDQQDGSTVVSASCPIQNGVVRYSLDGTNPTDSSTIIKNTIRVKDMEQFRAASFSADGKKSSLVTMNLDLPDWVRSKGAKVGQWKSGDIGPSNSVQTFEATGIITKNGVNALVFLPTQGEEEITIHSIELVRNDTDIVFTPKKFKPFTVSNNRKGGRYTINVNGYETGATFKFKVSMSSNGKGDSQGYVLMRSGK